MSAPRCKNKSRYPVRRPTSRIRMDAMVRTEETHTAVQDVKHRDVEGTLSHLGANAKSLMRPRTCV